jgi:hypothetical protein
LKYTVVWQRQAEAALARLWTKAIDRDAITKAANAIDGLLCREPEKVGESRAGNTRVLINPPLAVRYQVREQDRLVIVAAVWRWGKA